MEIALSLRLPRDRMSVTVARHIVRHAVEEVGVDPGCVHDIELSLSEACTNVLLHADSGDAYDVLLDLEDEHCVIRVVDIGHGLDQAVLSQTMPGGEAERGRGLLLMTALVDRVRFNGKPHDGTTVSMEKALVYSDRSLLEPEPPGDRSRA